MCVCISWCARCFDHQAEYENQKLRLIERMFLSPGKGSAASPSKPLWRKEGKEGVAQDAVQLNAQNLQAFGYNHFAKFSQVKDATPFWAETAVQLAKYAAEVQALRLVVQCRTSEARICLCVDILLQRLINILAICNSPEPIPIGVS